MSRVFIAVNNKGEIVHRKCIGKVLEDTPVKVELSKYNIEIGCTTITVDAAKKVLDRWKQEFESPIDFKTITMQEGFTGEPTPQHQ